MSNYKSKLSKEESMNVKRFSTMSAKIRYLHWKGYKVKEIHKELNILYQFARNIINNNVKNPKENFKIKDKNKS